MLIIWICIRRWNEKSRECAKIEEQGQINRRKAIENYQLGVRAGMAIVRAQEKNRAQEKIKTGEENAQRQQLGCEKQTGDTNEAEVQW